MTDFIVSGIRNRAFVLAMLLAGCGRGPGPAPTAEPATFTDIAREQGGYVYPIFQRWRIVESRVASPVSAPADLAGVPAILRGRFVYFDKTYLTLPSLNSGGDEIIPACFTLREQSLSAAPVSKRVGAGARSIDFKVLAPGRMNTILDGLFELTLQREPLPQDEGYQHRLLIAYFNQQQEVRSNDGRTLVCRIQPLPSLAPSARDLRFVATSSGREFVEHGGDMDPLTPINMSGLSTEWRSQLDSKQAANRVAGCAGSERVSRLMTGSAPDSPRSTIHALITTVDGVTSEGEPCERIVRLRRIDPAAIFDLFDVPGSPGPMAGRASLEIHLDEWLGESAFRARIGRLHFEFSDLDAERIRIALTDSIALQPSSPLPAAALPGSVSVPRPAEAPPVGGTRSGLGKIHRWVDANGVVNYSDRQDH